MRVAVVYSGEPRSYSQVQEQHAEFFEGVDIDTYHSTWSKTSEEGKELIKTAPNIKNLVEVNYEVPERPDLIRFEKCLLDMKRNHPIFMLGRIQYMTSMALYGVPWNKLMSYDLIVRMRYDFTYDAVLKDLVPDNIKFNDIFITRKMGGKSSPLNVWDGFAFGHPYAMSLYFDFNKWIPFSLFFSDIQGWKYQPEFVYGTYLRHVQLNVRDCEVQPEHVYWNDMNVEDHRFTRTVQYYRDLYTFHPEYYTTKWDKLTIENDSPAVTDQAIVRELENDGIYVVNHARNKQTPCVYNSIQTMFHGIPKNASTSIKNNLYEANWGKPFEASNKQWIHKGNEKGGSIYPSIDTVESDEYSDYKHFTVVRNPYQRFISFYNDLFLGSASNRTSPPPFYKLNGIKVEKKTVDEVIDIIEGYSDNEADEHFASQSSFIYGDNVEYLKMETLEDTWEEFCTKINIAFEPLPVYNKSDNAVLLTDNQKQKIYNRYKEDFERFNYER